MNSINKPIQRDDLVLEALAAKVKQHQARHKSLVKRAERYPLGAERRKLMESAMMHAEWAARYQARIGEMEGRANASQKT